MTLPDFTKLRAGGPECPSDFTLDRHVARELDPVATQKVETHAAGCADCQARLAERARGWDALPVDPRPIRAALRRAAEAPATPWWKRWLPMVGALATVLLAVVVWRLQEPEADTVRLKAGLALRVFRLENGKPHELNSGERFAAGDQLRFVVDLPQAGAVSVVGVDTTGALYVAWPLGTASAQQPAGVGVELPGAVELDATPGDETFFLVHCPGARSTPTCTAGARGQPPKCDPACGLTSFLVRKP